MNIDRNIWKLQMSVGWIMSIAEGSLVSISLLNSKFSWFTLILFVVWTLWSIYSTIRFYKIKAQQKEKEDVFFNEEEIDELILNKISIKKIEKFLREKKLKNIQK